ncbi:hypothetical protein CEXT_715721 [Caerostris extrusa]|uniref:Uncharacterized protein n=1 Tax=Caerostris extrusa TaxID=172846 RepID=A0AAV4PEI6_CAEEX|nr:hypothetical protein CEXT_715721 [Caerostris extrusa]
MKTVIRSTTLHDSRLIVLEIISPKLKKNFIRLAFLFLFAASLPRHLFKDKRVFSCIARNVSWEDNPSKLKRSTLASWYRIGFN